MNKNRIRLTESQLHRVIKESVNRVLNENQGFMDGVKGAWNGFKGSKALGGFKGAVTGAVKGYQQGQQGQQQVLDNRRTQGLEKCLAWLMNRLQIAQRCYQSGNIEKFQDQIEWIHSYTENILNDFNAQANQGIDYTADVDFSN